MNIQEFDIFFLEKALQELTELVSQYKAGEDADKESKKACSQIATTTFTAIFNAQTEQKTAGTNIGAANLPHETNQTHNGESTFDTCSMI